MDLHSVNSFRFEMRSIVQPVALTSALHRAHIGADRKNGIISKTDIFRKYQRGKSKYKRKW